MFRAADNPTAAANIVGALLTRWHYIALGAPVVLLLVEWRRARTIVISLLFAATVLAALEVVADVRVRTMRRESTVPISALDRSDPVRRRFGLLHGLSALLLIGQVLTAASISILDD